jgi:hypothetical protein
MKVKNKKILEILNQSSLEDFISLIIVFDKYEVYKRFPENGFSGVWKKFTNGLNKFQNLDNRTWYKSLDISGFYTYTIFEKQIKLQLFINKTLDFDEFMERLESICPIESFKITKGDFITMVESDTSLFGDYRINQQKWI